MRRRPQVPHREDPVLDVQAVSDLSGVSPMGVRRAFKSGALKGWRTKPGTGHFRTRLTSAEAWVATLAVEVEFDEPQAISA